MEKTTSPSLSLCGGVFLITFSIISFEITLTRLLSVVLSYHYVFLTLSLAMLGLGLGGMCVYLLWSKIKSWNSNFILLPSLASLFSLSISASVILIIIISHLDSLNSITILLYCGTLLLPFFTAGVLLAYVFRLFPTLSPKIYSADLIGGALGSLGVIYLLNTLGGISTAFLLGAFASTPAFFLITTGEKRNKKIAVLFCTNFILLSILFGSSVTGYYQPTLAIGRNPEKEIHDALTKFNGEIVETKWSAFGRTDLIAFGDFPNHMDIYIDGTAGSPMFKYSGNARKPGERADLLKTSFPGYFPFLFLEEEERNNALIIGPGGGRDILLALMGGVQEIITIEINKDLVELVRKYSWFNGNIYAGQKNVKTIVGEGRNFIKRQKDKYDIIMLSLPVTNSSRSLEGYALTENFLFTTESIGDYLDHLTDEGRLLVVGHNDFEVLRLLSISLAAFKKRGINVTRAMSQIYIVGSDEYPVFVLKKNPLKPATVFRMYPALHQFKLEPILSYFPYIKQVGSINPALMALGSGHIVFEGFEKMVRDRGYDIRPVTDNRPFFYQFEVGIPKPVALVFWSSAILMGLIIVIPHLYVRKKPSRSKASFKNTRYIQKGLPRSTALFSMIGMGFMLVEISFIQRFILFLEHPVLSLAVLLFSLLGGAGIGSLWCSRFTPSKINKVIYLTALFIFSMILVYTYLLPILFNQLMGVDLTTRVLTSIIVLVPLGFLMGIPFPLGIRWLKEKNLENHIPWMWGVNGASSVLGSVMTIVVATSFGFTESLLIGASCYLIVFLTFLRS
ncbi:MAG: hypothetical protein JSU83_09215 [Deltaproteobacteria bacterium]|nr:MAG: hypothetical protein JSU83_09215 [Deltaproteobacteria bacterium]